MAPYPYSHPYPHSNTSSSGASAASHRVHNQLQKYLFRESERGKDIRQITIIHFDGFCHTPWKRSSIHPPPPPLHYTQQKRRGVTAPVHISPSSGSAPHSHSTQRPATRRKRVDVNRCRLSPLTWECPAQHGRPTSYKSMAAVSQRPRHTLTLSPHLTSAARAHRTATPPRPARHCTAGSAPLCRQAAVAFLGRAECCVVNLWRSLHAGGRIPPQLVRPLTAGCARTARAA